MMENENLRALRTLNLHYLLKMKELLANSPTSTTYPLYPLFCDCDSRNGCILTHSKAEQVDCSDNVLSPSFSSKENKSSIYSTDLVILCKYLFFKKSLDLWLLKGIQRVNNLPLSIYENISYIYKARGEWCSGDRVSEELGSAANLFALRMSNLPLHQTQSSADPFSRVVLSMSLSLSLHQFLPLCFLSSPPLGGFERRDLNKLQSQIKLQFGFKARSRLFRFSMQKIEIHSMH